MFCTPEICWRWQRKNRKGVSKNFIIDVSDLFIRDVYASSGISRWSKQNSEVCEKVTVLQQPCEIDGQAVHGTVGVKILGIKQYSLTDTRREFFVERI